MVWIDVVRVVILVVCVTTLVLMSRAFFRQRNKWNEKTRDYWYGRMMWALVGVSSAIEGIARGVPFRYTLILIAAASLATLKGNLRKGPWGGED